MVTGDDERVTSANKHSKNERETQAPETRICPSDPTSALHTELVGCYQRVGGTDRLHIQSKPNDTKYVSLFSSVPPGEGRNSASTICLFNDTFSSI